jgi:hypothetical protein
LMMLLLPIRHLRRHNCQSESKWQTIRKNE